MSDHSISFVPKQLTYSGDRYAKAEEIVRWLVDAKAIEPELSDCVYGMGYHLLPGIIPFLPDPKYFYPNRMPLGLGVFTEKNPFLTIENGIDKVTCPECNTSLPDANAVYEMTGQWWDENRDIFPCPACGKSVSLVDWRMEPEWGFSDLGFEFWNCPMFTEDFVAEMKRRLDCDVWIVYKYM